MEYETATKKFYSADDIRIIARQRLKQEGGRVYGLTNTTGHYTITHVNKNKIYTWWLPGEDITEIRNETYEFAKKLQKEYGVVFENGIENLTPGRLCRQFIKQVLKLKFNNKTKMYGARYAYLGRTRSRLLDLRNLDLTVNTNEIIRSHPQLKVLLEEYQLSDIDWTIILPRVLAKEEWILFAEKGWIFDNAKAPTIDVIAELDRLHQFVIDPNHTHWHFTHLHPTNPKGYGIELDGKSMYLTAFKQEQTMFWYDPGYDKKQDKWSSCCWLGDMGAMNKLREFSAVMPKWFRLQLVGILASHSKTYTFLDKETGQPTTGHDWNGAIEYGAAFNLSHKIIYNVYRVMADLSLMLGARIWLGDKYSCTIEEEAEKSRLIRAHTDCWTLFADKTTEDEEADFLEELTKRGFLVACKGFGNCYYWDTERGILGNKPVIGDTVEIIQLMRQDGVKHYTPCATEELFNRWSHWLSNCSFTDYKLRDFRYDKKIKPDRSNQLPGYWVKAVGRNKKGFIWEKDTP